MKKSTPKILSAFLLIPFLAAIFCSLGLCSGMMKMANADQTSAMMQQHSTASTTQDNSCSPVSQSNDSKNCSCCKCLDTVAQIDYKNHVLTAASDFSKAFPYLTTLISQGSRTSHLQVFDHSPPKIAFNSIPIYILNRTLRL